MDTRRTKRRKIEFKTANIDYKKLHEVGYIILANEVNVSHAIEQKLVNIMEKKAQVIFNNPDKNDKKRRQAVVSRKSQLVRTFMEELDQKLVHFFPHLKPNDWMIVHSKPGCKAQAAHTDYPPSVDMLDIQTLPINVLVALQNETTIHLWPKSQGLICEDLPENKTSGLVMESEITKIKSETPKLQRGDMLLLRGDLIHAGAAYDKDNYRLHCYMDSSYHLANRTWLIHKHASKRVQNRILA